MENKKITHGGWDPIADAAAALATISARGIRVQEGWYQADLRALHLTLWLLELSPEDSSDDESETETARIQINIWSDRDEGALMREATALMRAGGWGWEGSFTDTDPRKPPTAASRAVHKNNRNPERKLKNAGKRNHYKSDRKVAPLLV